MKIIILGAGALGPLIGAHLARAGEEVTLLARGQRAKLIRQKGITVTGLANFDVMVNVLDNPKDIQEADTLLVAVKTYDTEEGLKSLTHLKVGSALSVQNGVLKNEQLTRYFGKEKTLGAAAVKASALQDLERDRRLEVEEILGYAVRKGKELDLKLPTVETCYKLLAGINGYLSEQHDGT